MSQFLDVLSWILLVTGGLISVAAGIGVLRLPDLFTRMHAASMLDTLGAACVLSGLFLQVGFTVVGFKLFMVFAFLAITSSTSAHALAKSALADGVMPHDVNPDEVVRLLGLASSSVSEAASKNEEESTSQP